MSGKSLSIIVAGAGKTSANEVTDLLNDFTDGYDRVDIYFPIDDQGFTDAVKFTTEWVENEELYPVLVAGSKVSRKARAFKDNAWEAKELFAEVFTLALEENDEAYLLVAIPDPDEDSDGYEDVVALIEKAVEVDLPVKDLTGGLDDVNLAEPDEDVSASEPEPEPEPEPAPPARKTRSRAARRAAKDADKKDEPKGDLQTDIVAARSGAAKAGKTKASVHLATLQRALSLFEKADESSALIYFTPEVSYKPLTISMREALEFFDAPAQEAPTADESLSEPAAEAETPSTTRRRGRPRTNVPSEKQFLDEDGTWVKRGRGRIAEGTKIRTVNSETGDVLEEGVI